jgi:hypothetical protein
MDKRKIPVLSIVLYTMAGMLVLYTIWSVKHSVDYISTLVKQGQLIIKGNEYNIVNYYMSNSAQYALFAVILFALGWILQNISSRKLIRFNAENIAPSSAKVMANGGDEDDLEDWFKNNAK